MRHAKREAENNLLSVSCMPASAGLPVQGIQNIRVAQPFHHRSRTGQQRTQHASKLMLDSKGRPLVSSGQATMREGTIALRLWYACGGSGAKVKETFTSSGQTWRIIVGIASRTFNQQNEAGRKIGTFNMRSEINIAALLTCHSDCPWHDLLRVPTLQLQQQASAWPAVGGSSVSQFRPGHKPRSKGMRT